MPFRLNDEGLTSTIDYYSFGKDRITDKHQWKSDTKLGTYIFPVRVLDKEGNLKHEYSKEEVQHMREEALKNDIVHTVGRQASDAAGIGRDFQCEVCNLTLKKRSIGQKYCKACSYEILKKNVAKTNERYKRNRKLKRENIDKSEKAQEVRRAMGLTV